MQPGRCFQCVVLVFSLFCSGCSSTKVHYKNTADQGSIKRLGLLFSPVEVRYTSILPGYEEFLYHTAEQELSKAQGISIVPIVSEPQVASIDAVAPEVVRTVCADRNLDALLVMNHRFGRVVTILYGVPFSETWDSYSKSKLFSKEGYLIMDVSFDTRLKVYLQNPPPDRTTRDSISAVINPILADVFGTKPDH